MKMQFWSVGKGHDSYVKEGIDMFTKRLTHYFPVEWLIIPMPKNAAMMSGPDLKIKEGEAILNLLNPKDHLILLEERGKQFTSESLAAYIRQLANESEKRIVFLIGGAYGVSKDVLERANYRWSLSNLVFPHQLVRLILTEQVYRACTIMRNEKYHHA